MAAGYMSTQTNTWGNDKITFDERVEFIKSMEREILSGLRHH